jgi:hypothetical protein
MHTSTSMTSRIAGVRPLGFFGFRLVGLPSVPGVVWCCLVFGLLFTVTRITGLVFLCIGRSDVSECL